MVRYDKAGRSIVGLICALAMLVLSPASAHGGSFSVTGSFNYGNDFNGLSFEGSTSDAAGISRQISRNVAALTPTSQAYHLESAAKASITGLGSYTFGQISQSAPKVGFGNGAMPVRAQSLAVGIYNDVQVSGPVGAVTTSVNLSLHGFVSLAAPITTPLDYTLAQGRAEVNFYVNGSFVGGGYQQRDLSYQGSVVAPSVTADGMLSLWQGFGTITSPSFTVPANEPFTLEVQLRTRIYAAGFTGEAFDSSAIAGFGDTLTFAQDGAVFNLPTGYTANSVDAGIIGNTFAIPEPSTLSLAYGAAFVFGITWGCRQRRSARQRSDRFDPGDTWK